MMSILTRVLREMLRSVRPTKYGLLVFVEPHVDIGGHTFFGVELAGGFRRKEKERETLSAFSHER